MIRYLAALIVVGFLFPVIAANAAMATKLNIGYATVSSGTSALWIAKDAGLFKKNGLDPELLYIQSALLNQAMLAGDPPLAMGGGGTSIEANLKGADFVILGSLRKTSNISFLVTRKDIIKHEQLRGKRLGVSRFGGGSDSITRMALRKIGIDPSREVTLLQIGNSPVRIAALRAGSIDATVLSVEESYGSEQLGLHTLLDLKELGIEYLTLEMVTTRRFLNEYEDSARRYVRSVVEAIHFFKNHKQKSMAIMSKYMKTTDPRLIELGYDSLVKEYLEKPYVSSVGLAATWEGIVAKDPKAKELKPEQFLETKFVKELDLSGFIDALYRSR